MKPEIINRTLLVILFGFLCILPWGFSDRFVLGQNGQLFILLFFSTLVVLVQGVKLLNPIRPFDLKITTIDLLLFTLLFVFVLPGFVLKRASMAQILETIACVVVYVTVRGLPKKYNLVIFCALFLACTSQAIYGNLQLYGVYPSLHSMFEMTGSFFNPGPFAGYLVSIFPLACALFLLKVSGGLYFLNKKKNASISNGEALAMAPENGTKPYPSQNLNNYLEGVLRVKASLIPKLIQYLVVITLLSVLILGSAIQSRAAWLATVASLFFILIQMWQQAYWEDVILFLRRWNAKRGITVKTSIIRATVVFLVVVIFSGGLLGMYFMKQNSAKGRLLIWKVSSKIIQEKPILGHGLASFETKYMDYQAKYFEKDTGSSETYIADNSTYAFNEFVRIWVETGGVGLILFMAIIFYVVLGKTEEYPPFELFLLIAVRAALLSIFVFSLFSYPAEIVPIKLNFVLFLAILSNYLIPIKSFRFVSAGNNSSVNSPGRRHSQIILRSILALVLLFGVYSFGRSGFKLYKANRAWKRAWTAYHLKAYKLCIKDYEKAFPMLKREGNFLLNYGKALSMAGEHNKAIDMLYYTKQYYSHSLLYTTLGDSYKALEQFDKAEEAYLFAWYMIPSRFYPKYLLAKLYQETGQKEKALKVANELLTKRVKVESLAIEEIREEMRELISNNK